MNIITINLIKELRERTGVGVVECKKALLKSKGNIELAIDNIRKLGLINTSKKQYNVTKEGIILTKTSLKKNYGVIIELSCETDFVSKGKYFIDFGNKIITYAVDNYITDINIIKNFFEEEKNMLIMKTGENINIKRLGVLKNNKIISYTHNMRIGVLLSINNYDEKNGKQIAMHIAANKPEYITPNNIPEDILAHEYKIQLDIAKKSKKPENIIKKIVEGRIQKYKNEISLIKQNFIMNLEKTVEQILKEKEIEIKSFLRYEIGE